MPEALTFLMGKFPAVLPAELRYARNHMWCRPADGALRFGFTSSKVMGWTGCTTLLFLSSFSSWSLDFFFLFLSLASPRPVGIGPSR